MGESVNKNLGHKPIAKNDNHKNGGNYWNANTSVECKKVDGE